MAAASPKPVKKVEFDTEDIKLRRRGSSCSSNLSPKPVIKTDADKSDNNIDIADKQTDKENELCVEYEPGTTDL